MKYIILIKDKMVIKNIVHYCLMIVNNPNVDRNTILKLNYDIKDESFNIMNNIFNNKVKSNKGMNDNQAIEITKKLYDMFYELEQLSTIFNSNEDGEI